MKKTKKILFLIILFVSLFFVFPNDVHAISASQCNDEAAKFRCQYYIPESGLIPDSIGEGILSVLSPAGYLDSNPTHYEMWFTYDICTDGRGGMVGTFSSFNAEGMYDVNAYPFLENPEYFYDRDTLTAKCPNAFIRVNNNTFSKGEIKIRKTKQNVMDLCTACTVYEVEADMLNYNGNPFYTDPTSFPSDPFDDCRAILGTEDYSLGWLIKKFLLYFKVLIPIVVLILSVVEFVKAIIINDEDTLKKAQKRLIIRLVIAIVLFLIPTIVDLLLDVFGFTASNCNL